MPTPRVTETTTSITSHPNLSTEKMFNCKVRNPLVPVTVMKASLASQVLYKPWQLPLCHHNQMVRASKNPTAQVAKRLSEMGNHKKGEKGKHVSTTRRDGCFILGSYYDFVTEKREQWIYPCGHIAQRPSESFVPVSMFIFAHQRRPCKNYRGLGWLRDWSLKTSFDEKQFVFLIKMVLCYFHSCMRVNVNKWVAVLFQLYITELIRIKMKKERSLITGLMRIKMCWDGQMTNRPFKFGSSLQESHHNVTGKSSGRTQ